MANEFIIRKGFISLSDSQVTGSLLISGSLTATSVTASIFGTSSWANNTNSSSFASTASYINTLNQNVLITGSVTIGSSSIGPTENTLTLGARDSVGEGGQLGFNASGGTYTSASFIDLYQNRLRILKGTNASSTGEVANWSMHTLQMSLPAYTNVSAFPGTAAALLAVDSGGNVLTVATGSGGGGTGTVTNIATAGSVNGITLTGGPISTTGTITLGGTLSGIQSNQLATSSLMIGSTNIALGATGSSLTGLTSVTATSFTGSFTGSLTGIATTASYVLQSVSSSFATTSATASYILQSVSSSFATSAATSSYNLNSVSSSFATTSATASYILRAISSSFATAASTASYVVSSSYALTASYALNAAGSGATFPYTGSATISGSLTVDGTISSSVLSVGGDQALNSTATFTSKGTSTYALYAKNSANTDYMRYRDDGQFQIFNSGAGTTGLWNGYDLVVYRLGRSGQGLINFDGEFALRDETGGTNLIIASSISRFLRGLTVTGSFSVSGSVFSTVGFTGSLLGTSSWSQNSVSSSYATTASYASVAQSVLGSITSASYAATASIATSASFSTTSSYALVAQSLLGSVTSASYAATSSIATSASYALTASYAMNGGGGSPAFPYTGNAFVSGSLTIQGSGSVLFLISGSQGQLFSISDSGSGSNLFAVSSGSLDILDVDNNKRVNISGSLVVTGSITGSLLGTSSYANTALSSSYALTASYALNGGGGGGPAFPYTGSATISGSLNVDGTGSFKASQGNAILTLTDTTSNNSAIFAIDSPIGGTPQLSLTTDRFVVNGTTRLGAIEVPSGFNVNTSTFYGYGFNDMYLQTDIANINIIHGGRSKATEVNSYTGFDLYLNPTGSANNGGTGNVLIGNPPATPAYKLNVSGSGNFNNGLTVTGSSNLAGNLTLVGSAIITSGSGFSGLLAGENLAAGDFVNIYSGGVRKASSNDTTKQAHGFVLDTVTAGAAVTVYYSGLNIAGTGLTAGARYFLSTSGTETTTPPTAAGQLSQEIGVAISTTTILVNFGPAIVT